MDVDLIVDGTTYSLSDGTYSYFYGFSGGGYSPLHRLRERGPLQHGETDVGFRLDPRYLTVMLAMPGQTYAAWATRRDNLYGILPVRDDYVSLRFTKANGVIRQLDCYLLNDGGMAANEEVQALNQKVPLVFNAPDPTYYDPTINTEIWTLAISDDLIVGHPVTLLTKFTIPFILGSATISATEAIVYAGTWRSYPVITLTGPMHYPTITNYTTDEQLKYEASIAIGASVVIDTSFDAKTVTTGAGVNVIDRLSDDSDLATFHLQENTTNNVNVTATGLVAGQSSIVMEYYTRYIGI